MHIKLRTVCLALIHTFGKYVEIFWRQKGSYGTRGIHVTVIELVVRYSQVLEYKVLFFPFMA